MDKFSRRRNGTGTVVFLGKGRYKPYAARLLVGKILMENLYIMI